MDIDIIYDSKWSFSSTKEGESYLNSMGVLKKDQNSSAIHFLKKEASFLENVAVIKKRFPHYDYQGIGKDTVLGLLCRLVGDVRRLDDVKKLPNHPIIGIEKDISFCDDPEYKQFQSETMLLHTPIKEVSGLGAGIISKDHFFASSNPLSEVLCSVFNARTLQDISQLYNGLKANKDNLLNGKYGKSITPLQIVEEMKFFENLTQENKSHFNSLVKTSKVKNIGGVLMVEMVAYLTRLNAFSKGKWRLADYVNNKGSFPGIGSSSGIFTVKDFYSLFVNKKKQSWVMPYQVNLYKDFFANDDQKILNTHANVGVIKECGRLRISIDRPYEECLALVQQIEEASVQTFQIGKKGLAYIEKIDLGEYE